jgi:uncharacterized protein (TIGR04222 family)
MRRLLLVVAVTCALPEAADAKDYTAQRFDVSIRALDDGSIQVTETVRMTFEGGPFTYLSREIPLRRTDGIDILGASMDGRVLARGTDPGQFDVRIKESRVAIRWHFDSTSDRTHAFRLSYVARGVLREDSGAHVLEWQALPGEHRYGIADSRITLDGAVFDGEPQIRARGVVDVRAKRSERGWTIETREIEPNGWVALAAPATLAAGVVPRWQQRERRQHALVPRLMQYAAIVTVVSLALVLLIWRQDPSPPILDDQGTVDTPPVPRSPAVAAAILAGGHSTNSHAPGVLFDLAARNVVTVTESEGRLKRRFTLARNEGITAKPHEATLLDVMFKGERSVEFSKAASRLARGGRSFRHAVNEELRRLGLTDESRQAVRHRLFVVGIALGVLSVAVAILLIVTDAGPWGLAIPLGMDVAAVVALGLAATRAELSDEGLRERQQWRAFRKSLKGSLGSTAPMGPSGPEPSALRYLPYVAAMGLAVPLSRYLRKHGTAASLPPWFRGLAGSDGSAAFATFVGTTATSTGGASASGGAGGGSSSAG